MGNNMKNGKTDLAQDHEFNTPAVEDKHINHLSKYMVTHKNLIHYLEYLMNFGIINQVMYCTKIPVKYD